MSHPSRRQILAGSLLLVATAAVAVAEDVKPLVRRTPWTTSRVVGTPDPPLPYVSEISYRGIKFYEPLAAARVPDGKRLVIAERPGKIYTFEDRPDVAERRQLLDVGRTTYGVAMHPQYLDNGLFFVSAESTVDGQAMMQVLRYRAPRPRTMRADPASREVIISWPSDGHRGGCLRFGPDGYLYIAVGDGSGIADGLRTGQDLSDLLGSILRIDVDRADDGRPYAIPDDNPFVGRQGARGEVYSYGHRQVWKFSFDREDRLWGGDVGQDLWEMVYVIKKGGNYGWSVREGKHPFRPERPRGPTPFEDPLVEHSHNDFRSITGGHVYYGSRIAELRGSYVYADYDTGRVWMLRYRDGQVVENRELADTVLRTVAFLENHSGELFIIDFAGGHLHRLVETPPVTEPAPPFPRKLSETGLFDSVKDNTPAAGVIPYSINSPLWSDGAEKERLIALPGNRQIEFDAVTYPQPAPGAQPGWRFPDGTVLVKSFSLQLEPGKPESRRRLETRLLHLKTMPGDDDEYGAQYWRGYTYVWNDEQTDAELLAADGLDRTYTILDPLAPGGKREQAWHFPSRSECTSCHTMAAKYSLGVNSLQMNRIGHYNGRPQNQLRYLEQLGVFREPLPRPPEQLPRIVDYRDEHHDLNLRARAYLHANCSHCHRKWGGGNGDFQLLASLPLNETGTLGVRPDHGRFELDNPRLLAPGSTQRSLIHYRMQKIGEGRMPHVASNVVDRDAAELISRWIRELALNDQARTGITVGTGRDSPLP